MKRIILVVIFAIIITFLALYSFHDDDKIKEKGFQKPRSGVAIIMTGAAARIPQEAALLEELDNRDLLKDLVFISGVSSGALNSVMLNGILSKKMSWDRYKNILFNIKTSDIFVQNDKKLPVNTSPARTLFTNVVEDSLGYHTIGDLPYYTAISFTHIENLYFKKNVYRMCSRKINSESDTTLNLVDIMMASSAFPLVFPAIKIQNVKTIPDANYVDGGVGDDHVPYHALIEFEKYRGVGVEKVYIISRGTDSIPSVSEELKALGMDDNGLFDKLGISMDAYLKKGIDRRLKQFAKDAPELTSRSYVWIPKLDAEFLLFNFDSLKKQYDMTTEWAKTNEPIPLDVYLSKMREEL